MILLFCAFSQYFGVTQAKLLLYVGDMDKNK